VGQRARGTCCPPFLRFDNRMPVTYIMLSITGVIDVRY